MSNTNLQAANVVKLQELIHKGAVSAQKVLERVMNDVPSDTLSPMGEMRFGIDADKLAMTVAGKTMSLHRHALMQLSEDTGLPQKFLATFPERGAWGRELVADALERTFRNGVDPKKRLLVRHVRGEARGILSDRYRRLDSGLLLESFVKAIAGTGIQPYEGLATDTRFTIQCVEDKLYYPVPGEAHARGLTFGHSDYGDGALEVRAFFMRLACTNGMMAKNHMRQVHIGTKLSEDIMWSERTFRADSELSASKLADTIASAVDPKVIDLEFNKLTQAYEERIDPKKAAESAAKALGSKETAKAIAEAFNGADVENMPAGNTRARWANAISWVANASDDAARKLQLQGYAAEVIGLAPPGAGRTTAFGELPTAIAPRLVPASWEAGTGRVRLVAIASKLNQEKNMSTSVMTKAQHWRLVLKMSYEAGARNAIGLGVKPAAIKAAIRRHREREEAARENLDLLAAREPGGAVKRWTLLCLGAAIDEADFRTTTHGHTTYAEVADFASVQGYVTNHRPSELGLPNAYANKGFTVTCSTHSFQVTPAWIRDVKMRGCAVVGGLLTLDLGPEIEPGIFQSTWVEQGRGTTLRARTGHLVDIGHGLWKHADSLIAARRVHRAGRLPPPVEKPALPRDAKKLLSRAKLTGNETVTRGFARLAGHCEAGIRDWVARHGLDDETEITTRRLAEAACDSGDRIEDVYLVLLAVSRAARKARAA